MQAESDKKTEHRLKRANELEALLPHYTEHLNRIRFLYGQNESFIRACQNNTSIDLADLQEMERQLSFSGFLTICSLDLLVTSKNLLRSQEIWEEIFYLRHGYLTIYESLNTYNAYNRWLKNLIDSKYPTLTQNFKSVSKFIKEFKKDFSFEKHMAEIRNQAIAHIDASFPDYFMRISNFDIDKATEALLAFVNILSSMHNLLKQIGIESFAFVQKKNTDLDAFVQKEINTLNELFEELGKST